MSSPHYRPDEEVLKKPEMITKVSEGYIIKPRALEITWGGDNRYWHLPPPSKPTDPVELMQVSWLQVTGTLPLEKLQKGKYYKLSFKLQLKPDAFGWEGNPVYIMAKPGKNSPNTWKKADLSLLSPRRGNVFEVPSNSSPLKFSVPKNIEKNDTLQFGLYEIWGKGWKGGMAIHNVVIELAD